MRILRIVISIAFVIVIAVSIVFRVTNTTDLAAPVISCSADTLHVKCDVTDEELLGYIKAYDAKDGDLTGSTIVESISAFIEIGVSRVTYTVCDSDNNVAKLSKRIVFTDYHAPRIYMKDSFMFNVDDDETDLLSHIGATDLFDGDISHKVTIVASSFKGDVSGTYDVTCKVANSMGDYSIVTLSAIVNADKYTSSIVPKSYHYTYYINVGDSFNAADCIWRIVDTKTGNDSAAYTASDVRIDTSQLNTAEAGTYNVFFTITNPESQRVAARTRISVICEEK